MLKNALKPELHPSVFDSLSIENKKQKQIAEYYGITNVAKIENKYSLIIDAVFGNSRCIVVTFVTFMPVLSPLQSGI